MEESIRGLLAELKDTRDWEDTIFRWACALARTVAERLFTAVDDELATREDGWHSEGKRAHTVVTRFGPVRVRRRLYQDGQGQYRFRLDEVVGIASGARVSGKLDEVALRLASQLPYAQASAILTDLLPEGTVSKTAVHRLVQTRMGREVAAEAAEAEAVYSGAVAAPVGERVVARLFVEADGVNVPLQREATRRAEIKVGVAHEGWEQVGADRYALVEKTRYAGVLEGDAFWERLSLKLGRRYDLATIEPVVVGGDGAGWVREGAAWLNGQFQLDRYHLQRAIREAYGREEVGAQAVYRACVRGEMEEAVRLLVAREGVGPRAVAERLRQVRRYITENAAGLRDYRQGLATGTEDLRGLGAIESNVDKLIAHRMKHRGMSWTVAGADHMARLQVCREEGRLGAVVDHGDATAPARARRAVSEGVKKQVQRSIGEWLQVSMPVLRGPHADRPWACALAALAQLPIVSSDPHRLTVLPTKP